jgi:hypothetical protein
VSLSSQAFFSQCGNGDVRLTTYLRLSEICFLNFSSGSKAKSARSSIRASRSSENGLRSISTSLWLLSASLEDLDSLHANTRASTQDCRLALFSFYFAPPLFYFLIHLSFAEFLLHAKIEGEHLVAANHITRRCCEYINALYCIQLKYGPWSVTQH